MGNRRRSSGSSSSPLDPLFVADRRDRHPGTHFSDEFGSPKVARARKKEDEPHVDEDLGCSEFGIDFPGLRRS